MKLRNTDTPDGMRAHEEYQCEAVSLLDGLRRLPELGAPNDLCERALAADLQEICTVSFRRCAVLLQEGDTVCEMALDEGELRHNGKSAPLCEIELGMSQAARIPSTRLPQSWRSSLTLWLNRPASWRERWRCKISLYKTAPIQYNGNCNRGNEVLPWVCTLNRNFELMTSAY